MTAVALSLGTLIVLEGVDETGKSTQAAALRKVLEPSTTHHVHMPSGTTSFTRKVYNLLESVDEAPANGAARQLAHLACHAETVPQLRRLLQTGGLVLDRWWWSSLAYGWFTGDIPSTGISEATFRDLVESVWRSVTASVVFLFEKPYGPEASNTTTIVNGYRRLAKENPSTVPVPRGDVDEVTVFMLEELRTRNLIGG